MFEVYKVQSVRVLCAVRSLCSYLVTCPQVRRTQTRRTSTYNTEPSSPLPSLLSPLLPSPPYTSQWIINQKHCSHS